MYLIRVPARVTVVVHCTSTLVRLQKDGFKLWKELFLEVLDVGEIFQLGTPG